MTRWIGDDFEEALSRPLRDLSTRDPIHYDLVRDLGLDLPPVPSEDVVGAWLPAAHAARLLISGYNLHLTSPGPYWLNKVQEYNPTLLGREVITMRANEIEPKEGFWKPAEAKLPYFEAKWRTKEEIEKDIQLLHPRSFVQYSPTFLDIIREERHFIQQVSANRYAISRSTYLEGEWIYYHDLEKRVADRSAYDLVMDSLAAFSAFSPRGYVIDTATLATGETVILEANPAWCSAAYASDMEVVVNAITASMGDGYPTHCRWVPDSSLARDAGRKPVLRKR